jgi:hypothetical protein
LSVELSLVESEKGGVCDFRRKYVLKYFVSQGNYKYYV